jgi:hypothetical protein
VYIYVKRAAGIVGVGSFIGRSRRASILSSAARKSAADLSSCARRWFQRFLLLQNFSVAFLSAKLIKLFFVLITNRREFSLRI